MKNLNIILLQNNGFCLHIYTLCYLVVSFCQIKKKKSGLTPGPKYRSSQMYILRKQMINFTEL